MGLASGFMGSGFSGGATLVSLLGNHFAYSPHRKDFRERFSATNRLSTYGFWYTDARSTMFLVLRVDSQLPNTLSPGVMILVERGK